MPSGGTRRGPEGRPGRPERGDIRSSPKTDSSTSAYTGYSSLQTSSGTRPPSRSRTPPSSTSALSCVRGPTTTSSTRRLSGSKATWSHWSPLNQSASSWVLQCFCFLPTNDHFSSTCTLVVQGGKAHQLLMELASVAAGAAAIADHGVRADADQAAGLANAAAIGQVSQYGPGLVVGQAAIEQRRALALGEAGLAGLAVQQAALLLAIVAAHRQVALTALAMVRASGILTAEAAQIIVHHSRPKSGKQARIVTASYCRTRTSS